MWRVDWRKPRQRNEGSIWEVDLASSFIDWMSSMKKREKSRMTLRFWPEA